MSFMRLLKLMMLNQSRLALADRAKRVLDRAFFGYPDKTYGEPVWFSFDAAESNCPLVRSDLYFNSYFDPVLKPIAETKLGSMPAQLHTDLQIEADQEPGPSAAPGRRAKPAT
jgi:hypothetical protein